MIEFTTRIEQFQEQGEKTGWTYVEIPTDVASQLSPGSRQSFRVKGKLDDYTISKLAVMPLGGGRFILPLNATIRKAIHKRKGAMLKLRLELDDEPLIVCEELLESLAFDTDAQAFFDTLTRSHQLYFSKWIESAKTEETRSRRIAHAVNGLAKGWDYGRILRNMRDERRELGL